MLVRLTSSTSGEMIMFAEHARRLFEIVGKECTARGVFTTEQLPAAIARLRQAVQDDRQAQQSGERQDQRDGVDEREEDEEHAEARKAGRIGVSLGQRAQPLINLLEWTQKEGGFVLWEAEHDF